MKILTLTIQNAKNMGAQLQCYALSKFLNSQADITCEVLCYYPIRWNRSWQYFKKPVDFKTFVVFLYRIVRIDQFLLFKRKNRKMKAFLDTYIPLTNERYFREDILANPPFADAIVCGSDQIWNFKLRKDFTYLLDFVKDERTKRIAYAASMAEPWTTNECVEAQPLLRRFDAIGIREQSDLSLINSLLERPTARVVVDPVFLLTKTEWDKLARNPSISESYIFCYFLGTDDYTVKAVNKIKELTGYKIIHLNLNNRDRFNSDKNIIVADPCDFIGLIAHASMVCTNSFHCTAFSLIYKKNIRYIPRKTANSRIFSLQHIFQIPNLVLDPSNLSDIKKDDLITDYTHCQQAMSMMISFSKNFLLDALYEKH
jgi:hypothetical protein